MVISLEQHRTERQNAEVAEIAATAELAALRRAMKVRIHLDELQRGVVIRVDNVLSFAAHNRSM